MQAFYKFVVFCGYFFACAVGTFVLADIILCIAPKLSEGFGAIDKKLLIHLGIVVNGAFIATTSWVIAKTLFGNFDEIRGNIWQNLLLIFYCIASLVSFIALLVTFFSYSFSGPDPAGKLTIIQLALIQLGIAVCVLAGRYWIKSTRRALKKSAK